MKLFSGFNCSYLLSNVWNYANFSSKQNVDLTHTWRGSEEYAGKMKNKHFLWTYSLAAYCILFNPNPSLESCFIPAWWVGYAVLAPLEFTGSAGRMLITTEVKTVSRRVRDVARFLHMEKMVSVFWGLQMSCLSVFETPLLFIKVVLATKNYHEGTDIKVCGNNCGSLCIICWLLQL